jgi:hypothetical protein
MQLTHPQQGHGAQTDAHPVSINFYSPPSARTYFPRPLSHYFLIDLCINYDPQCVQNLHTLGVRYRRIIPGT